MIVSVSAVLLLGVFVYLLWRYARLPLWQAAICVLFGYLLAASSLGPGHRRRAPPPRPLCLPTPSLGKEIP